MNQNDLLDLFNSVRDQYVAEAMANRDTARPSFGKKKLLLIAAIIALMTLLMGSAVVYFRLQDMSIGKETYIEKHDEQGHSLEPTEKEQAILTFYGHSDEPVQLAMKEWYAFTESYDPNMEFMTNEANVPDIPDNFEFIYGCYTQEMVDELTQIAEKHGLNLLDSSMLVQRWSNDAALEALNIESLFRSSESMEVNSLSGTLYAPVNFWFDFSMTLTGEDALWQTPVSGREFYSRKDHMAAPSYFSLDQDSYEQWDYTAADGTKLLLALSSRGTAVIVADLKDAVIGITLNISVNYQMTGEGTAPTKEIPEQIADTFDYQIQPDLQDPAATKAKLEQLDQEWEAQQFTESANAASLEGLGESLTEEELTAVYAKLMAGSRYSHYSRYTLRDINGDGVTDLLVSSDSLEDIDPGSGSYYWCAYTVHEGAVKQIRLNDFYLCEDGVLEYYIWGVSMESEREETHTFLRLEGSEQTTLDHLVYNRAKDQWFSGEELTPVSDAEAQAILDKYPRIDQDMRPISELLGE